MPFQDRLHDVFGISLALVQEMFGGGDNRSVVALDFDLGGTIRFHGATCGRLRPGPGHFDGSDLQRQDIGSFDDGPDECAAAFHDPEPDECAVGQFLFRSGNNQDLIRPDLGIAAEHHEHEEEHDQYYYDDVDNDYAGKVHNSI